MGHRGADVVDLQARLKNIQKYDLEVDGYFGEQTLMAVRNFQIGHGLVIDGIAGNQTRAVLTNLTDHALLYLFIHCSASAPSALHVTAEWIKEYHMERRGWSRPGYSDVVELNGTIKNIYEYDHDGKVEKDEYTWGTRMLNRNARHICYVGGIDDDGNAKDTRTKAQKKSLAAYVHTAIAYNPTLIVVGHNQVQKKACPSFDVPQWLISCGVDTHNIALWNDNLKRI